ncbi:hypothetical protein COR50_16785 [Chitinophaga caeni]|uniref:Uncharacterized protein n=1 Tax=Chitinophaga caeni TaxID=2029983 RepID=A0A291QXU5_9BACT|nr:c-type cytochrome domain-containing protein [Chitinophaga caeni]ATL48684.1 hypothetical protein COR50_16785 [Chitinophaga caeni]
MNLQIDQGSWGEFLGRSHPLLVHLPIGILLLAMVLALLARKEQWGKLRSSIPIILLLGFISAVSSCITGYLLSLDGGYEEGILTTHQYLGITVAVCSLVLYIFYRKEDKFKNWQLPGLVIIALLLGITGHYGGSLTHGDAYLSEAMPGGLRRLVGGSDEKNVTVSYTDISEAKLYEDLVQPVLASKCYGCHNEQKLKGGLRLETIALIRKGGEHGPVLKDSMPASSELFRRLLLPENDEHRMPPKGKPGVSPHELALLEWWIAQGAPADKKVKDIPKSPVVIAVLEGMQGSGDGMQNEFVPGETVSAGDKNAIRALIEKGVKVLPVSEESNYLSITCMNAGSFSNEDMKLLLPLKSQLIWLDLSGTAIDDEALQQLSELHYLTRLNVKQTKISGGKLAALSSCKQLKYLNLSGNTLIEPDLAGLKNNKSLQQLYLFGSGVPAEKVTALKTMLPALKIDTGDAALPRIASDTIIYHKVPG